MTIRNSLTYHNLYVGYYLSAGLLDGQLKEPDFRSEVEFQFFREVHFQIEEMDWSQPYARGAE